MRNRFSSRTSGIETGLLKLGYASGKAEAASVTGLIATVSVSEGRTPIGSSVAASTAAVYGDSQQLPLSENSKTNAIATKMAISTKTLVLLIIFSFKLKYLPFIKDK